MRFEVSERLRTERSPEEVLAFLEEQFRKVAESVHTHGAVLEVEDIEATFGSINRNDTTMVSVKPHADGMVLVAEVNYRPSIAFWIILAITLFTYVFWLIPVAFYLMQKVTVRDAIANCFRRAQNEFGVAGGAAEAQPTGNGALDELEKLAQLRDRGIVTEEEFAAKKKLLLGL